MRGKAGNADHADEAGNRQSAHAEKGELNAVQCPPGNLIPEGNFSCLWLSVWSAERPHSISLLKTVERVIKSRSFLSKRAAFMVGLTEPDPNQYDAIIRQKVKVIQAAKNFGQAVTFIIADDAERHNREIDVFGEIAVKRLKQPYRREFSEADIKQMVSAYQSGETTTIKLAERFGCSKTTINKLLRQHGVEVTRAKAQARLNADAVVAMYDEMRTTEEIAECFHVHPQVVIRCLRANGVKIRSRWDYAKK